MTATDQKATNLIGDRLSREMQDYGASLADLGRLIGISGAGVSKWNLNANGVAFYRAQQLAFILGTTVDELANTGKLAQPVKGKTADLRELSQHIIQVVDAGTIKCPELAFDAKTRAVTYLSNVITMEEANKPATSKLGDVSSLNGPSNSCDARPASNPGKRQVPFESNSTPESPDDNQIRMFLHQAEKFRQNTGLTWHVDDNGRLRAQKVTTVTY